MADRPQSTALPAANQQQAHTARRTEVRRRGATVQALIECGVCRRVDFPKANDLWHKPGLHHHTALGDVERSRV